MKPQFFTLSTSISDGEPPTEFRLFTKGVNSTENGEFVFDAAAAKSVMAAYEKWGVDLMIDLEHQSLEVEGGAPDPTARDARGWCKLELRDGELWACDVKWTPDGERRLREKTQRYISPAFKSDPKTRRVLKMFNIAITAMPATHDTPALVAASVQRKPGMDLKVIKEALDAIAEGDDAKATEILKHLIASAAADGEGTGDEDGSEGDGGEGVAPPKPEKEAVIDPKVVANKEDPKEHEEDEDEEYEKNKASYKAMRAMFLRTTSSASFAEALNVVESWKASHASLATERAALEADRAKLEASDRRQLCIELVKLGAEFPATIFVDPLAKTNKKLKSRWLNMPIVELRSHVEEQRAARGAKADKAAGVQPPAGTVTAGAATIDAEVAKLTAQELQFCKDAGADPKDYAALKVRRDGAQH
jgi:phage I-like protein